MGKKFKFEVLTPERVFYTDEVDMIIFNTPAGEMGILPDHMPMVTAVEVGVLKIKNDDKEEFASIGEGFIEVTKECVTAIVDSAEWPDEIDLKRAESAYNRAKERLEKKSGDIDVVRAEIALKKSLARINVLK